MGCARILSFVLIAYCGGWSNAAGQRVIFVDAAAKGAGDGSNWTDAVVSLSSALALAQTGDRVWVATGTYRAGPSRADTFRLKEEVEIVGGLAGNEIPAGFLLAHRDLVQNETVLDGDIGVFGPADNVFHIVTAAIVSRSAVLDGFTIANGNASGLTLMQQDVGGALFIINASPTIRRCLIRDNQAGSRGGAVHIAGGSPHFAHCRFVGNRTTVTQAANNIGGAAYFAGTATSLASPLFVNCLFVGNRAGVGNGGSGGAMYGGEHATATLINCTLLHNRADTLTGGVFGSATIANSIFHRNQDHNGFDLTAQLRGAVVVSHSLVQGGWPGDGNLNADPLLLDPFGPDGLAGTMDDDAKLLAGSPCIDAGNNFAWPTDSELVDLDGGARFINDPVAIDSGQPPGAALIDMGVYEKQSICAVVADCDDALFCNGEETCANGHCRPGSAPNCMDDVSCTRDRCAEADRACVHEADDTLCDNGLFCDGLEACDAVLGCIFGAAPNCDDSISCTVDYCDEQASQCIHTADHAACDDDVFCNGAELCGDTGCTAGVSPCASVLICDEDLDQCTAPLTNCDIDTDCDDDNSCTDDSCVFGDCERIFNELPCNDGNACTANDQCGSGTCTGELIANCGTPPIDPGPGATGPPTVDPPDEVTPPVVEDAPEADPDETDTDDPPQPEDADDDGVLDPFDLCPSTPVGQSTDASGCSTDEPTPGRGTLTYEEGARRCGACGAMGAVGVLMMVGLPGTILVLGRPRGRTFIH